MLQGFYAEMEKIAAARALEKLAATGLSLEELVKLAEADAEIYLLMKQAGFFSRVGRATQKGIDAAKPKLRNAYNAAQVRTGDLMQGSFGHGTEHAIQKLHTTASPTKAALVFATDPHVRKAVGEGARKAGKRVSTGAQSLLERARNAVMPSPGLRPAYA